jgi:hypothetical protein
MVLSRAFQHYQKQRVRSYDLERLQHDHLQTNKETCITCISIYRLCACFYVSNFVRFDNLVAIILMHNNKWFTVLFNLMQLSLETSYVEPSNPTICMLLGSYKELEFAQNF